MVDLGNRTMKTVVWGMAAWWSERGNAAPFRVFRCNHRCREHLAKGRILDSLRNPAEEHVSCETQPTCLDVNILILTDECGPGKKGGHRKVADDQHHYRDDCPFDYMTSHDSLSSPNVSCHRRRWSRRTSGLHTLVMHLIGPPGRVSISR